jgi:hypothetical protein
MFTSYEMTRAFVAERQDTLRHEARQHHLGRSRRVRRELSGGRVVRLSAPGEEAPGPACGEDRAAA